MKVISVIYMSRRNFWCVTRGDSWHLNFQLQKVDWEPSGRQNQVKMMEFWKILYIHFIRDPKGITYVRLILKIESDAKMAGPIVITINGGLFNFNLFSTKYFISDFIQWNMVIILSRRWWVILIFFIHLQIKSQIWLMSWKCTKFSCFEK